MTILSALLAVTLLRDPANSSGEAATAVASEGTGRGGQRRTHVEVADACIRSRTCDFDRKEGVVMFEGDVVVRYSGNYTMCSDQLYMFLSKSNDLSRAVALGNVSITNETRSGTCAMATYRRRKREVEMFGDGKSVPARLTDFGENAGEIEGVRIRFWLDAEQVEVENSSVRMEKKGSEKVL